MIYIDTNVFINATTEDRVFGKPCTRIMEEIEAEKLEALCSRLVLVEYVNALNHINRELKRRARDPFPVGELTDALLSLIPHWHELGDQVIKRASTKTFRMNPADYFHVATMEVGGIDTMISADSDFDKVGWIKRIDPRRYRATGAPAPEKH